MRGRRLRVKGNCSVKARSAREISELLRSRREKKNRPERAPDWGLKLMGTDKLLPVPLGKASTKSEISVV